MSKYDIFISYASLDREPIDICTQLERNGLKCWIAPRNIPPGMPYARAIIQGLEESENVLVFISANSLRSDDVLNEIDFAHRNKKNIIPVFTSNLQLNSEFAYYLNRLQWINLYEDKEIAISSVLNLIRNISKPEILKTNNVEIVDNFDIIDKFPPYSIEFFFKRVEDQKNPSKNGSLLMPIEDVFDIKGHGVVLTGNVERGIISIGDKITIFDSDCRFEASVRAIEQFRELKSLVQAGNDCGILLNEDYSKADFKRGMVIVNNDNEIYTTNEIRICLYLYTESEGGVYCKYQVNDKLLLYSRYNLIECVITQLSNSEITNGNYVTAELMLSSAIYLGLNDIVCLYKKSKNQEFVGVGMVYRFMEE